MSSRKQLPNPVTLNSSQSLEPALAHARSLYARMLADLAKHRDAAQGDDALAWLLLFERLAHDAVWAVTELHRGAETKYFRQRFISERARRHWADASTRGECTQGVQHEHVFEARDIKRLLGEARTEEQFCAALSEAVACVVTHEDHDDLNRKAKDLQGWARYAKAGVAVWDRLEERWHPPAACGRDAPARNDLHDVIDPAPASQRAEPIASLR